MVILPFALENDRNVGISDKNIFGFWINSHAQQWPMELNVRRFIYLQTFMDDFL